MFFMLCVKMVGLVFCPLHSPAVPHSPEIFGLELRDIDGQSTSLAAHSGKVLLLVNVASECGFTGQYAGLQELHERFGEQGLVVCGFPSNDFGGQEPGNEEVIREFCSINYGVTFSMFAKVRVRGDEMHPLFRLLVEHSRHGGALKWNFTKFLVGRDGEVARRFAPFTKPTSRRVVKAVEGLL